MTVLEALIAEFRRQKSLAERALEQLTDDELFAPAEREDNSLVVLAQHLAGNMRSRWTEVFTTDGEKPDRRRDAEFVAHLTTRSDLVREWEAGWTCLLDFLDGLTDRDLDRVVVIRGRKGPLHASLVRQLGHYAYHVGQMVYVAKSRRGDAWRTLTIPRGQSDEFLGHRGPSG